MRFAVVCLIIASATIGALGGSLYGEKEDAIAAIQTRYDEVVNYARNVFEHVKSEKEKNAEAAEKDALKVNEDQTQKTLTEFAADVTATTRTAIAKGKPLSVIDCIFKNSVEGREAILKVEAANKKAVEDVKKTKKDVLDLAEFEINLIGTAMKGLKEESVNKLNAANSGFQALKTDGLKKLDSAKKQFDEIERRIPKPVLLDEFLRIKQQVPTKFNEVRQANVKKLQSCL